MVNLIKFHEIHHFQWIIRNLMKLNEFPVPTWGYWFFIFTWILKIFRILRFSVKNQKFIIFAEKSENLCKIHTFSPDAENSNKPYGFIGILGEFHQIRWSSLNLIKSEFLQGKWKCNSKYEFNQNIRFGCRKLSNLSNS